MTAADLIKRFEGCRLTAYPDPDSDRAKCKQETGIDDPALDGSPWTIGWGCTGPSIHEGMVITQAEADDMMAHRLAALQDVVLHLVTKSVSPNQLAALLSLAWNIGSHAFSTSTVLKRLNAGDYTGAANAFEMWVRAKGRIDPKLQQRRLAEKLIFLGPPALPAGAPTSTPAPS